MTHVCVWFTQSVRIKRPHLAAAKEGLCHNPPFCFSFSYSPLLSFFHFSSPAVDSTLVSLTTTTNNKQQTTNLMRERRRFSTSLQPLDTTTTTTVDINGLATSFSTLTTTTTTTAPQPSPPVVTIPYHFRCPISLELMTDPVTISTGQTYDRHSIESWVQSGHVTCPVTRVPLSTEPLTLIPNHTLRRLIQDWCVTQCVDRIPTPKQPAEPSLIRHLLHQSTNHHRPLHIRVAAIRKLRQLARESDKNRNLLSTFLFPRNPLLPLVFTTDDDVITELRNEALAVVAMFPIDDTDCTWLASDSNRIEYLSAMLFDSDSDVRINSAAVIESVVTGSQSDEIRTSIAATAGIFEGVVGVLSDPGATTRGIRIGIRSLFAITVAAKRERRRAVAAGAITAVVMRLVRGELSERGEVERGAATIEMLVRVDEGCMEVSEDREAVIAMVGLLACGGRKSGVFGGRAAEHAAGVLLVVCTASDTAKEVAVGAGVVTQLLMLVQSGCTDRAKRKAQRLLKLLRDSWPVDEIANSDDFLCYSDVVRY